MVCYLVLKIANTAGGKRRCAGERQLKFKVYLRHYDR